MPIRISKNRVALENTPLNEAKGADIASATTVNLDSATGNLVHITGTTTITAITLSSGYERTLIFDGSLTLTHNSTTLILPGNSNITTSVGDRAIFRGDGTGVRCISYTKASGQAVVSSGSFLRRTVYTSGSGTWNKGTGANYILLRMVGAGGGSGGGPGSSAYGRAGAGAGYLEKFLDVSPATSGTYVVGAATFGDGTSNRAPSSTFTFNSVTYTATGGEHGNNTNDDAESSAGSGVGGDINLRGQNGARWTSSAGNRNGGNAGGGFGLGEKQGGSAVQDSQGTGYGWGAGAHNDATAHTGGGGIIIVDEYS